MVKIEIDVPAGLLWLFETEDKLRAYIETTIRESFDQVLKNVTVKLTKEPEDHGKDRI